MKRYANSLIMLLGLGALALRRGLYMQALDAKGLLIPGHPLGTALLALSLLALGVIALTVLKSQETEADNARASLGAALGYFLMAGGILLTVMGNRPPMDNYLGSLWQILGYLGPMGLAAAGYCRLRGRKPWFGMDLLPCLFLVLHIVNHYQMFSGDPQFQDYIFDLLGAMALTFFAFYNTAVDVDMGNRRMRLAMGLGAVYLCLGALAMTDYPCLYLAGTIWALHAQ